MNWQFLFFRRACAVAGIGCCIAAGAARAQALPDALAPVAGFTPVLTISDSIKDTLKTTTEAGITFREVVVAGTTKISITANIAGLDLTQIDENTEFAVSVGGLTVAGSLGDAAAYTEGKTTAFIAFNTDDLGAPKGTNGIRLSWTATRLTIVITRAIGDGNDPGDVMASQLAGQTDPKVRDSVEAAVQFGAVASAPRPVFIQGTASVRTQTAGAAPDIEEFFLNTVTLTGAGDFIVPTVTITTPKPNTSPGANATIIGTAKDSINIARIEYATNPDASVWTDVAFTLVPPLPPDPGWGPTTAAWTFDLANRPVGTTLVMVRAVDGSGNTSKMATISFANPMPVLLSGRWDALLEPESADGLRGFITFTCDAKGALSGKLTQEGTAAPIPFKGTWFGTSLQAVIKVKGKPDLLLAATVDSLTPADAAAASAAGQLQFTGAASPAALFTAVRSHWSAKVPLPIAAIGRYHYFLDASSAPPVLGHGYVILTTSKAGTVKGAGKLADGTGITFSGVLGSGGQVPLYVALYTSKGSFSVLAVIAIDTGLPAGAPAAWRRPNNVSDKQFPLGFLLSPAMTGAKYAAPPANTRIFGLTNAAPGVVATWEGDAVTPAQTQNFTLNTANKAALVPNNPAALKVNIATATGLITGDFKLPGSTVVAKYDAIIVGNEARGFYAAPAVAGSTVKRFGRMQLQPGP